MKKKIILTLLCIILAGAGCRRVSHNGAIDGYWRIRTIEYKDGTPEEHPEDLFIAIQCELMQLWQTVPSGAQKRDVPTGEMTYDKDAGRLSVDFRDPVNLTLARLHQFGVCSNPVTFKVHVDGSTMVLTTPESVITCLKW